MEKNGENSGPRRCHSMIWTVTDCNSDAHANSTLTGMQDFHEQDTKTMVDVSQDKLRISRIDSKVKGVEDINEEGDVERIEEHDLQHRFKYLKQVSASSN